MILRLFAKLARPPPGRMLRALAAVAVGLRLALPVSAAKYVSAVALASGFLGYRAQGLRGEDDGVEGRLDFLGAGGSAELPHVAEGWLDVRDVPEGKSVLAALAEATRNTAPSEAKRQEWRRRQLEMFRRTRPIRAWMGERRGAVRNVAEDPAEWSAAMLDCYGPLSDESFFRFFRQRMEDPNFYTGLIYVPIPWRFVNEDSVVTLKTNRVAAMTARLLAGLRGEGLYFTLMEQSHPGELADRLHLRQGRISWRRLLVFDSRGTTVAFRASGGSSGGGCWSSTRGWRTRGGPLPSRGCPCPSSTHGRRRFRRSLWPRSRRGSSSQEGATARKGRGCSQVAPAASRAVATSGASTAAARSFPRTSFEGPCTTRPGL
uniref:Uncharacterized protein n=1 Tax=Alexandrium monilatum TaxID=311494 RepID=A0A7S4QLJ0_9DINO